MTVANISMRSIATASENHINMNMLLGVGNGSGAHLGPVLHVRLPRRMDHGRRLLQNAEYTVCRMWFLGSSMPDDIGSQLSVCSWTSELNKCKSMQDQGQSRARLRKSEIKLRMRDHNPTRVSISLNTIPALKPRMQ